MALFNLIDLISGPQRRQGMMQPPQPRRAPAPMEDPEPVMRPSGRPATGFFGQGATAGQAPQQPQAKGGKGMSPWAAAALGFVGGGDVANIILQRKQQERELQLAEMRRQQEQQDWLARKRWERENPEPYRFTSNDGDVYQVGPDGKPTRLFDDPSPKVTWQEVDLGNGQKKLYPVVGGRIVTDEGAQAAPTGGSTPPPEAVQFLRQNPSAAADFDAKYGPGAAARVMQGGASPTGSQTFP